MYIDIRSQLVPILVSFVALGIGIVIGSMLSTDHGLLVEQQLLIDDLEQQFAELRDSAASQRAEIERLREALAERDEVIERLLPEVAGKRLADRNLVLLDIGSDQLSDRVAELFTEWGAQLMVVRADPGLELMNLDSTVAKVLYERLLVPVGKEAPLVEGFGVAGVLAGRPDAVVMVVDPSMNQLFGTLLTPLVSSLRVEKIHLVAVEQSGATTLLNMWRRLGVSTVDNVDSPVGLLSLVLLANGSTGHYGVGPSVDRLMPLPEAPAQEGLSGQ